MDSITKYGVGAVAIVALVLGFLAYSRVTPTIVTNPPYGAVSGSDFPGPSLSVGGLYTYSSKVPFNKTASTTCSFRSPTEGTSTLVVAAFNISSSTSAATIWEIGKASNAYSTTTLIGTLFNVPSASLGTVVASSTLTGSVPTTFAAGTYLNVKSAGVAAGINGTCIAEFLVN